MVYHFRGVYGTLASYSMSDGTNAILTGLSPLLITVDIGYHDYHLMTNIGYCDNFSDSQSTMTFSLLGNYHPMTTGLLDIVTI